MIEWTSKHFSLAILHWPGDLRLAFSAGVVRRPNSWAAWVGIELGAYTLHFGARS